MNAETLRRAEQIFERAVEAAPARQAALLTELCGGDDKLRRFVEELLKSAAGPTGPLDDPLFALSGEESGAAGDELPVSIGPYDVLGLIGYGGMAVVYEARQENPPRIVALKVMRPGFSSRSLMRRFQHEAEVLGRLQHPGIAHIYEAAAGDVVARDGTRRRQPYFAMERIRGAPLHVYAERNGLGVASRLELMVRVCDAVQYAHQKGVIHRDLKPANILVVEDSPPRPSNAGVQEGARPRGEPEATFPGTPMPKVLDFGVARVISPDTVAATMDTQVGQLVGTLAYMSPEQIGGEVDQIDTRSDVYSLGVILFELLSGRLPHDVRNVTLTEAARRIRDDPPPSLGTIDRRLRGEIDIIVARALQKNRERRYQSAHDLGQDIQRHLQGDAIEARRDSAFYVMRKGLWRYRGAVAGVALVLTALAGFAVYNAAQAAHFERLSRNEQIANVKARAASEFLKGVIELANPGPAGGYDRTLIDVLDEATERLRRGVLAGQPDVEAEVRQTLARTYGNLFLFDPQIVHLDWLLQYYERTGLERSRTYIETLCRLADAHAEASLQEAGEPLLRRALDLGRELFGDDSIEVAGLKELLGNNLMRQRRGAEALPFGLAAVETFVRHTGEDSVRTATARFDLAGIYRNLREREREVQEYAKARAVLFDVPEDPVLTVRFRQYYFQDIPQRDGRLEEAERGFRETTELAARALGADHPETLATMFRLARCVRARGRLDEATQLLADAFEVYKRVRSSITVGELRIALELVSCLAERGDFERAALVLNTEIDRFTRLRGPAYSGTLSLIERLAELERERSDHSAALRWYDELISRAAADADVDPAQLAKWRAAANALRAEGAP